MMKKTTKLLCLLSTLIFLGPWLSMPGVRAAEPEDTAPDDGETLLAPYFILLDEELSLDTFPLKSTDVTASINGMIAEIYVVQTYANEGDKPINARYVFPTSPDVTVHGMTMEIGNHIVTAKIREKEEAKAEYEEARSEGKSASLLEQKRPNVFTMDVANIMPGDTARITLHYTELIAPRDGLYEFIFPTVSGPRYAPLEPVREAEESDPYYKSLLRKNENPSASPLKGQDDDLWVSSPYLADGETPPGEYHITVNLSTGVPIDEVTCKSHEIHVDQTGESTAAVTLANPEDYAGNRDFILKYRLTGDQVQSGLVLTESGDEKYFMLTVQPPRDFTAEDIPPREYLFVLDISGSMYGYPLDTAKALIRDLVSHLKETDKFNLVLFSDDTIKLSPDSLYASAENVSHAMELIDREEGGGGTSMIPALEAAMEIPQDENTARSVVVITDGYVSNESDIFDLISRNMDTAGFFSFGIGSSVNSYLVNGIARLGLGESFIVTDSEDAADSAARFRTYIESPLLTDVTVDYEGFDVYDVVTATPSILYAQKPIVLFGKWKGQPSGTITLSGKSGNSDYVQELPVSGVTVDKENQAVRYLWARTKLDQLAGYGSIRNDASVKDEITRIGLDYNMTTPYTSFVAVIDEVRNPEKKSASVDQASPLPLGVSNLAVGGGYQAYSEPGGILLLLTGSAVLFLVFRKRHKMPFNRNEKCS